MPRSIVPFETMVNSKGGKISWAVIPHRILEAPIQHDQIVQELLTSIQHGNEVVQHGYNHQCPVCIDPSHEMWCSTYQVPVPDSIQESFIARGNRILRDSLHFRPDIFVPPGHAADTTTYRLLVENHFTLISTIGVSQQELYPGLFNLAPNNEYTWNMNSTNYAPRLHQALSDIRRAAANSGFYCLLLHDGFIRSGYLNGIVLRWTAELLDSTRMEYGNKIRFMTLGEAAENLHRIPERYQPQSDPLSEHLHHISNYPNPFNSVTTIQYELNKTARVTLTIYSLTGQKVQTLVQQFQSPGKYQVYWQPGQLSAGIYFCKLETGRSYQLIKLINLK